MQIKKYSDFILERLGVPEGIVESATRLYDEIITKFKEYPDDKFSDVAYGKKVGDKLQLTKDIPVNIIISNMNFNKVIFDINIHFSQRYPQLDIASWGVAVPHTAVDGYKLIHDLTNQDLNLKVDFVSQETNKFTDIINYLLDRRSHLIGVLSHELKHVYDKYMMGQQTLVDIIDYQSWAKTSTGFNELDEFFYSLYLTSQAENLVRPSEIAGYIKSSDITKSEFKEFLEETKIYKELIRIKKWSYKGLKEELLSNIERIRTQFGDIPEDESDEDVIEVVLNIAYRSLVEKSAEIAEDILDLNNVIKQLSGRIKEADIDFYNDYIKSRLFKNVDEFFLYWEKKLNFTSESVIKKIGKLYDMCKDDNINTSMVKINDRINGKCIVNPKLYKEVVIKTSSNTSEKIQYRKK